MNKQERIYSILILASNEEFANTFYPLLTPYKYSPICLVSNTNEAQEKLKENSYDFIIIDSPISTSDATEFAIAISQTKNSLIMLAIENENVKQVHNKTAPYGIFILPKPISKNAVLTALSWLESANEKLKKTQRQLALAQNKAKELQTINHAKWLLIDKMGMSEGKAHRYIEKQAMDRCVKKLEVAKEIIKKYSS